MPPETIVDELPRLADALVALIGREQRRALADRGLFAIALSGGSAATKLLPTLARGGLDWSRTDVFWADERAVPADDPESNYALARTLLLEPAGVPAGRIHRMEGDSRDLERAAASYGEEMARVLGSPPRLDLALLGVGEDGHVASLFPGHAALAERRLVVPVTDSPKPPARRITLTLPALAAARHVIVFATGGAKAPIARAAVDGVDPTLPVVRLLRDAPAATVLLDPDAASALPASR